MKDNRIAYSVREAGEVTGYSEHLIRQAIKTKKLKVGRPGGSGDYRILVEDLRAWLRGDGMPTKNRPPGPAATRHRAA